MPKPSLPSTQKEDNGVSCFSKMACYCPATVSPPDGSKQLIPTTMPWDFQTIESTTGIPPWKHDFLLLDINKAVLESTVSCVLGRPYLQPWLGAVVEWPVTGKMVGDHHRMMISLSTSLSSTKAAEIGITAPKIAVHFLVDTEAPATYLCEDAILALSPVKFYYDEYMCIPVILHGFKHQVHLSPQKGHFRDVNLIGSDFLALIQASLVADYGEAKSFSIFRGPGIFEFPEN